MAADVEPVVIPNLGGERLFGLLHRPSDGRHCRLGVVILSPGIKSRVAPHRLYVKLARRLARRGFLVLRFDFYGLGDSEGDVDERQVADLYGSIQVGRYADDTIAAIDWLEREHGVSKVVLTGLCGGAITGMFAGVRDHRVRALIGMGIPVILDSGKVLRTKFLTTNELEYFGRGYLRRLGSFQSWIRLLTFQSDYSVIFRSLKVYLKKLLGLTKPTVVNTEKPATGSGDGSADNMGNYNPHFSKAFLGMLSAGKKIFLAFGETERLYWQFEEKFYRRHSSEIARYPGRYELHLVKGARHIYEEPAHQADVFGRIESWLAAESESLDRSEAAENRAAERVSGR